MTFLIAQYSIFNKYLKINANKALKVIINGDAFEYRKQYLQRIEQIVNNSKNDVSVKKISIDLELFPDDDLTTDPNFWVNKAWATFYNIGTIKVE